MKTLNVPNYKLHFLTDAEELKVSMPIENENPTFEGEVVSFYASWDQINAFNFRSHKLTYAQYLDFKTGFTLLIAIRHE